MWLGLVINNIIVNKGATELNDGQYICNGNQYALTCKLSSIFSVRRTLRIYSTSLGKPFLSLAQKNSVTVTEGGFAEVSCVALVGFANGQNLTWTWSIIPDDTSVQPITITDSMATITYVGPKSTLVYRNVKSNLKGKIMCTVNNTIGGDSQQVILRVKGLIFSLFILFNFIISHKIFPFKDTLAALWPFLAIIGEVVILCVIILIFEKKCAKKEATSEDEAENLLV